MESDAGGGEEEGGGGRRGVLILAFLQIAVVNLYINADSKIALKHDVYSAVYPRRDVWYHVVMSVQVFTCGKMPYGRRKNAEVVAMVQEGVVLDQPRYCPHNVYQVSCDIARCR